MSGSKTRSRLRHVLDLFFTAALTVIGLIVVTVVLFVSNTVRNQLGTAPKPTHMDPSSFRIEGRGTQAQLVFVDKYVGNLGCVAMVARGFARVDPDDESIIDFQIVTNAPTIIGLSVNDLVSGRQITPVAQNNRGHVVNTRIYMPLPGYLSTGGWFFAEEVTTSPCGYFRGLLPATTNVLIGPEVPLTR